MLLIGKTGVGKSHVAQALGHRACMGGHHVLYTSAHDMLTQLRASRADESFDRRMPWTACSTTARSWAAWDGGRRRPPLWPSN